MHEDTIIRDMLADSHATKTFGLYHTEDTSRMVADNLFAKALQLSGTRRQIQDVGHRLLFLRIETALLKSAAELRHGSPLPRTEVHEDTAPSSDSLGVTGKRVSWRSPVNVRLSSSEEPRVQQVLQAIKELGPKPGSIKISRHAGLHEGLTKRIIRNFGLSTKAFRKSWLDGELHLPEIRAMSQAERQEIFQFHVRNPRVGKDEIARRFNRQYKQIADTFSYYFPKFKQ